ncbi:MAG: hypothetical protein JOZ54_22470 [Acidobacteria bacterium]|nr:hypothetical protein [Acidobacteriota bacterium]
MVAIRPIVVCVAALLVFTACRRNEPPAPETAAAPATTSSVATTSSNPNPPDPCATSTAPGGVSQIPPVQISGSVPVSVPLPAQINSPTQIRPNFDWFSWEQFIAFNWPASSTGRGNAQSPNDPNTFLKAAAGTQTVWGTYKANWEVFNQGNARPTPWDSWQAAIPAQCTKAKPGERELLMSSKGNTVLNDGVQAFSFPLVDANRNYLFYEVRYGRATYDFIRGADNDPSSWLYLAKNLSPPKQQTMPASTSSPYSLGAVMIKAAWRDMAAVPKSQWSRYYVTTAQVYDPTTTQCSAHDVGLVGFHIAQKTKDFPEWVWSSFEQVDVLGGLLPNCAAGDTNCSQVHGFAHRPTSITLEPDPSKRTPVNAARLNEIPTTPPGAATTDVNATFQKALAGTPWAYYQLVITQWPTNGTTFKPIENGGAYPCWSGQPFPANGAVNLTLETYFQSKSDGFGAGGNSCMQCHYGAGLYDYSWGLKRRPHA